MFKSDELKKQAALRALELVVSGMRLGLGTGSTAKHFVAGLGEKCAAGLDVRCVPTSEETRKQAVGLNIPLSNLDELGGLDLTVDGADEMDEFISEFRQRKYGRDMQPPEMDGGKALQSLMS